MSAYSIIILSILFSLPIVGLMAIVRAVVCAYRSSKAKWKKFVYVSVVNIILMLAILAFVVVVLFGYGVAHTGKTVSNDFVVLAITAIPTYLGAFGSWRLSIFIEGRLS